MTDEARADELLDELRQAETLIRATTVRRRELVLEAHRIGLTTTKIAEAVGVSRPSVSNWVRAAARDLSGGEAATDATNSR